ncbi:MAG TPA: hypothetical protein VK158_02915 [Acidobacteriota bacterium]|nr:hypothetical protein [Acidobacteriota bacterium]
MRRIVRWIILFFMVFLLINITMSVFLTIDLATTVPVVLTSVYEYSSNDSHDQLATRIQTMCDDFATYDAQFSDTRIKELIAQCNPVNKAAMVSTCSKKETLSAAEQQNIDEVCKSLESGTFDLRCKGLMDEEKERESFAHLKSNCVLLGENRMSHKDFFIQMVADAIPDTQDLMTNETDLPIGVLVDQNSVFISRDWTIVLTKITAFFLLWYALYLTTQTMDEFLHLSRRVFYSIAIFIGMVYVLMRIYMWLWPPDTSFILEAIAQNENMSQSLPQMLLALIPILLLQVLGIFSLIFAGICFAIGFVLFLAERYYDHSHHKPPVARQPQVIPK